MKRVHHILFTTLLLLIAFIVQFSQSQQSQQQQPSITFLSNHDTKLIALAHNLTSIDDTSCFHIDIHRSDMNENPSPLFPNVGGTIAISLVNLDFSSGVLPTRNWSIQLVRESDDVDNDENDENEGIEVLEERQYMNGNTPLFWVARLNRIISKKMSVLACLSMSTVTPNTMTNPTVMDTKEHDKMLFMMMYGDRGQDEYMNENQMNHQNPHRHSVGNNHENENRNENNNNHNNYETYSYYGMMGGGDASHVVFNETLAVTVSYYCPSTHVESNRKMSPAFSCDSCPANSQRLNFLMKRCICRDGYYNLQYSRWMIQQQQQQLRENVTNLQDYASAVMIWSGETNERSGMDDGDDDGVECVACPDGAQCTYDVVSNNSTVIPRNGYYPLIEMVNGDIVFKFVKCANQDACNHRLVDGLSNRIIGNLQFMNDYSRYYSDMLHQHFELLNDNNGTLNNGTDQVKQEKGVVNGLCSVGYKGYLCGVCRDGYYRIGQRCLKCGNVHANRTAIAAFVFGLLVVGVLLIPMAWLNTYVPSFSVVLNFIQITVLFTSFNLNWDGVILDNLSTFSLLNLNIQTLRTECISDYSFFGEFMVMILIPVGYLLGLIFIVMLASVIFVSCRYQNWSPWQRIMQYCTGSILSFIIQGGSVYLFYWIFSFHSCESVGNSGSSHLNRHYWSTDIICSRKKNMTFRTYEVFFWLALAIYVIIICLFLPLITYLAVLISRIMHRRALKKLGVPQQEATDEEQKELFNFTFEIWPGTVRAIGWLYYRYRRNYFFWELIILLRKVLIVFCIAYIPVKPIISVVITSLIIILSLASTLTAFPYRRVTSTLLDAFLLLIQYLILILALMVHVSDSSDFKASYLAMTRAIVLTLFYVGMVVGVIVVIIELSKALRTRFLALNAGEIGRWDFDMAPSILKARLLKEERDEETKKKRLNYDLPLDDVNKSAGEDEWQPTVKTPKTPVSTAKPPKIENDNAAVIYEAAPSSSEVSYPISVTSPSSPPPPPPPPPPMPMGKSRAPPSI